jgi:hypothetical protein
MRTGSGRLPARAGQRSPAGHRFSVVSVTKNCQTAAGPAALPGRRRKRGDTHAWFRFGLDRIVRYLVIRITHIFIAFRTVAGESSQSFTGQAP